MPKPVVREKELHAFLDGELTPERAARVAARLRARPDLALRLERYRADREAVARAFANAGDAVGG